MPSAVAEVDTPQPGGAGCGTLPFEVLHALLSRLYSTNYPGKLASMTLDPF